MIRTRLLCCVLLCCLAAVGACKNEKVPKEVLPQPKMQAIMWDLFRADELLTQKQVQDTAFNRVASGDSLYQKVYAIHHVTRQQFKTSYNYYQQHPAMLKALIDSLHAFAVRRVPMAPAY